MNMSFERDVIEKKCWRKPFELIRLGVKTFDVRGEGFEGREGDVMRLQEWDEETQQFTGRELDALIVHQCRTSECPPEYGLAKGVVVNGLKVYVERDAQGDETQRE